MKTTLLILFIALVSSCCNSLTEKEKVLLKVIKIINLIENDTTRDLGLTVMYYEISPEEIEILPDFFKNYVHNNHCRYSRNLSRKNRLREKRYIDSLATIDKVWIMNK